MDAYGHVNHANTVTLLEEARLALLFGEAQQYDAGSMSEGIVVARLVVDYHTPLVVNDGSSVRVEMTVRDLRAASFRIDYTVYKGLDPADPVVATAETMMVTYDLKAQRARRLTATERDFLAGYEVAVRGA
jgi:acyl-CoA thioester hydrolase